MRLCLIRTEGSGLKPGFFGDEWVIPLDTAARHVGTDIPLGDSLLPLLPGGQAAETVRQLAERLATADGIDRLRLPIDSVSLEVPVPNPGKLLLLAGNYAEHIREGGGHAEQRIRTFPYVFMKPPATTLTRPGEAVVIPALSPEHIDWEVELGVIIGRTCRSVSEADALKYIAGYTIVNDISDRRFQPNSERTERPKDGFFDWLHGKWHDTFCPMGPCVLPADELDDPQTLDLTLRVNGTVEQDASTSQMIFPVAGIVEFVSSFVTLRAGDVISTGTPSGVGSAKGKYLRPGDTLEAQIERIGTLRNPVVSEG